MTNSRTTERLSSFTLRRRTPGTFVLVPFTKQGRSIRCQGQLEAATAQVLAGCPLVHEIQEQPLTIWYAWSEQTGAITLLNGPPTKAFRKSNRCSYIVPDFLVTMQCGRKRLIEVKPSAKLDRPLVHRKLTVAQRFAERQGWTFHVVTERELFTGPLVANIRLLGRFRRLVVEPILLNQIQAIVERQPMVLDNLLPFHNDEHPLRVAALHLVAVGRLAVDLLAAPITGASLLLPGGTVRWDPFDSVWGPSGSATNGPIASCDSRAPTNSSLKTCGLDKNERLRKVRF